jgi:hypothetical protein
LPQAVPQKWGWWEPLDRNFNVQDLQSLVPGDRPCETVYWQRKKRPKVEGSFSVRWCSKSPKVHDTHSNISFTVELEQVDQVALVACLKDMSVRTKADFALLDMLTDSYKDFAIDSGSAPYGERYMVVTHVLRHWLPDVFWATVFGPPYVRLFGKERLLSAPGYIVQELAPETVYVQLTERIADVAVSPARIQSRRELFKKHLGLDAFFQSGRGYDRLQRGPIGDAFTVPQFELIAQ